MKRFAEYAMEREQGLGGMGGGPDAAAAEPSEEGRINAFKVAAKKYPEETKKFLNDLAEKDEEVRSALQSLSGSGAGDGGPTDRDREENKDVVMPSKADGSPGMTQGGDEA